MADRGSVGDLFRILGDPTRLSLFERIVSAGELSVGTLVAGSQVSQPAVSQHLAVMRSAGLVAETRSGRHVLYRAPEGALLAIATWLERCAPDLRGGKRLPDGVVERASETGALVTSDAEP